MSGAAERLAFRFSPDKIGKLEAGPWGRHETGRDEAISAGREYRVGDGRYSRLDSVTVELIEGWIFRIEGAGETIHLLPHEARHVRNRLNALLSTIVEKEGGDR